MGNILLQSINAELDYEDDILPAMIPGRVLQLDGDFVCYHCTCRENESFESMTKAAHAQIEKLRLLAGAESVMFHVTGNGGDKGGRYSYAIQKEYQGTRKGRVKPQHLERMRKLLADEYPSHYWVGQEADDGMCQGNWDAIQAGRRELSVICSKDKDLRMCQGLHIDWDTYELYDVAGFGTIWLDDSKSSKKLVGRGNKFFWAQMLMGDTADNIAGLPKIMPEIYEAATGKKIKAPKPCGPAMAHTLLESVETDKDALALVKSAYEAYGLAYGFSHWQTGKLMEWKKVMFSEAILLWMRRTETHNDFVNYVKGECQ